jgi:hypothetical protein
LSRSASTKHSLNTEQLLEDNLHPEMIFSLHIPSYLVITEVSPD